MNDVRTRMNDYIRKDDVLALLEKYRIELPSTYSAGLTTAKNAVKGMPTADVLPRTEVAREIFAEIEDVIREIGYFDELDFTALKKKYGVIEE